jgi:hypothetical protein
VRRVHRCVASCPSAPRVTDPSVASVLMVAMAPRESHVKLETSEAKRSRCARARRYVGPQNFRDGDVVALEFTGVAGGGAVYGWG